MEAINDGESHLRTWTKNENESEDYKMETSNETLKKTAVGLLIKKQALQDSAELQRQAASWELPIGQVPAGSDPAEWLAGQLEAQISKLENEIRALQERQAETSKFTAGEQAVAEYAKKHDLNLDDAGDYAKAISESGALKGGD